MGLSRPSDDGRRGGRPPPGSRRRRHCPNRGRIPNAPGGRCRRRAHRHSVGGIGRSSVLGHAVGAGSVGRTGPRLAAGHAGGTEPDMTGGRRIFALWAVPRSTSTAFEWMMRVR
ncbi:MAG: hypothetical protein F4015_01270, partial [Acidimicrobiia bacterium]|nr:hypothetical protein [Acidimicrobiia bacterium]